MVITFSFWAILAIIGLICYLIIYIFKWRKNRKIVSFRGRLLSQINNARKQKKLKPLGRVKFFDKVAIRHSTNMAKRKHCDHLGFNGRSNYIQRKAGVTYVGENCYMFPATNYNLRVAQQLVKGWLDSPGHRANILNKRYKRTGIGIVVRKGYVFATQLFSD